VVGLVYIAAFGLDEGESLGALLSQGPVAPALLTLFTDQRGFIWLSEEDFRRTLRGRRGPPAGARKCGPSSSLSRDPRSRP